jgi:hypothetical protein
MGTLVRSAFRFPRASSTSGVQVKRSVFLKRRYRGRCRCFGSDRAPGVAPQGAFRSRTVLSTVVQWFVLVARETADNDLQVWVALKCVIPYVLARVLYTVGYKVIL